MAIEYKLRGATNDDLPLLRELRRITMSDVVTSHYPWDDEIQNKRAESHLDCTKIIVIDGRDVGMVKVVTYEREMHLSQIQILPEYQERGIGTAIIRDLQAESRRKRIPLTLQVLKKNRAVGLYLRLGFVVKEEGEHASTMKYL